MLLLLRLAVGYRSDGVYPVVYALPDRRHLLTHRHLLATWWPCTEMHDLHDIPLTSHDVRLAIATLALALTTLEMISLLIRFPVAIGCLQVQVFLPVGLADRLAHPHGKLQPVHLPHMFLQFVRCWIMRTNLR